MHATSLFGFGALALAVSTLPLVAEEREFNFALGPGLVGVSAYPGSDDMELRPSFGFKFRRFSFGTTSFGSGVGVIPKNGVSLRGAFRLVDSREAEDHPELAGLTDIDTAVELGFGITYRQTNWLAFAEVLQGFGGHSGVTGTLGADVIFRPTDRWTITLGPRVNMGSSDYANTYFGVTAADAAASSFGAFDADGGVLGAGVTATANYSLNDKWSVDMLMSYEKLQNAAADSPITLRGSDDQFKVSIGLSREFTLRF